MSVRPLRDLILFFALLVAQTVFGASAAKSEFARTEKLVPLQRSSSLAARDVPLVFTDQIILDYGQESAGSVRASVTFTAHPDRPIILLEDLGTRLRSVTCGTSSTLRPGEQILDIAFDSDADYEEALDSWSSFETLHVLTLHLHCNPTNEHRAWRVLAIMSDPSRLTLHLVVEPLEFKRIGPSYTVRFSQSSEVGSQPHHHLQRRQDNSNTSTLELDWLSNGDRWSADTNLNDTDLSTSIDMKNAQLNLTCTDCHIKAKVDLDTVFTGTENDTLTTASIDVTFNEFDQAMVLQVALSKTLSIHPTVDLFVVPGTSFEIPGLLTLGPRIGVAVEFNLTVSGNADFTFGTKSTIPQGAHISMNLLNLTPTASKEWDSASLDSTPFRLNGGNLNVDASIALSPFIEVAAWAKGFETFQARARLSQRTPLLYLGAAANNTVNRECQPVGANDFEYFTSAYTMHTGIKMMTVGSTAFPSFLAWTGISSELVTFWEHEWPLLNSGNSSCYVVVDDKAGAQPTVAATGLLAAATSAVPKFDYAKIESYSSQNGHLPTNVNYVQMAQQTDLPDSLKKTVDEQAKKQGGGKMASARQCWIVSTSFLITFFVFSI